MDDQTKILIELSTKLGSIDSKLSSVCDTILGHESRIVCIEQRLAKFNGQSADEGFKNEMLKLLAKAVVIGLTVIATLTGGASIAAKILGVS